MRFAPHADALEQPPRAFVFRITLGINPVNSRTESVTYHRFERLAGISAKTVFFVYDADIVDLVFKGWGHTLCVGKPFDPLTVDIVLFKLG